jgi:hypothetical protein
VSESGAGEAFSFDYDAFYLRALAVLSGPVFSCEVQVAYSEVPDEEVIYEPQRLHKNGVGDFW